MAFIYGLIIGAVGGGTVVAIYYKNIMAKYGAITTAAAAIKKAV